MADLFRCQAVLKHVSGLPRDNATNTFWFRAPGGAATEETAEVVAQLVRDFYTLDNGAAGGIESVGYFLSKSIVNAGHEVKVTPIVEDTGLDSRGIGFPPMWIESFDLLGRVNPATSLPAEVAVCLSFKHVSSSAVPPARRRGRVYIGPLGGNALTDDSGVMRPNVSVRETLGWAADNLHDAAEGEGTPWVIYSRPYEGRAEVARPGNPRGPLPAIAAREGNTYTVTDVWVDNAFDTVRKRGERPTARSAYDVANG